MKLSKKDFSDMPKENISGYRVPKLRVIFTLFHLNYIRKEGWNAMVVDEEFSESLPFKKKYEVTEGYPCGYGLTKKAALEDLRRQAWHKIRYTNRLNIHALIAANKGRVK